MADQDDEGLVRGTRQAAEDLERTFAEGREGQGIRDPECRRRGRDRLVS